MLTFIEQYPGFIILMVALAIVILYSMLFGSDRRLLRSRKYCYRQSHLPSISDEEFCRKQEFIDHCIPVEYIKAKRFEIGDCYLDFPPESLSPEMIWEEIPLDVSPSERDEEKLVFYLKELGLKPKEFLYGKTVAQIIIDMYRIESQILWESVSMKPGCWTRELAAMKRKVQDGSLESIEISRTIAEFVILLWRIHNER